MYLTSMIRRLRSHKQIRLPHYFRSAFHSTGSQCESSTRLQDQEKSTTKSLYLDTVPPTAEQSTAASHFFQTHQPHISWVANEWRKQAHSSGPSQSRKSSGSRPALLTPEIAFLGRSNTGKSSLLNALLDGPNLCRVGAKPGKTTTMHAWTLTAAAGHIHKSRASIDLADRLTVLDMPGYGHGSRDEWGADIVKYLKRRRQLRRAMVLLNPKHGIKEGDEQILQLLASNGIPHQIIACKCDMLATSELSSRLMQLKEDLRRHDENKSRMSSSAIRINDVLAIGKLGDGKMNKTGDFRSGFGLDEVRWAILQAVGLDDFSMQNSSTLKSKPQKRVQDI